MTIEQAKDQAAREFVGHYDHTFNNWEHLILFGNGDEIEKCTDRAMEIYGEAAFNAAREISIQNKCAICGADRGLHHFETMQCPKNGVEESRAGHKQEWMDYLVYTEMEQHIYPTFTDYKNSKI